MSKTAVQKKPITVPVWGAATSFGGGGRGGGFPPSPSLVTSLILAIRTTVPVYKAMFQFFYVGVRRGLHTDAT